MLHTRNKHTAHIYIFCTCVTFFLCILPLNFRNVTSCSLTNVFNKLFEQVCWTILSEKLTYDVFRAIRLLISGSQAHASRQRWLIPKGIFSMKICHFLNFLQTSGRAHKRQEFLIASQKGSRFGFNTKRFNGRGRRKNGFVETQFCAYFWRQFLPSAAFKHLIGFFRSLMQSTFSSLMSFCNFSYRTTLSQAPLKSFWSK